MTGDARRRARAFLLDAHQLTEPEAEEALAVAARVLGPGLKNLRAAIAAGDSRAGAETAHSLKGNLLNLGLPELARIAQQAMDGIRQGDAATAATAADSLDLALEPLLPDSPDESLFAKTPPAAGRE